MAHFTQRRTLAVGVGFCSIGLSSFAFNPLFQLLVELYAWRGALLVLGGLSLNLVACGALVRPRQSSKSPEDKVGHHWTAVLLCRIKANPTSFSTSRFSVSSSQQLDSRSRTPCATVLRRVLSYLHPQLLLQRPFFTYSLALTFINIGFFVPYFHLVAHSRQAGFSDYQAAFVMSAAGVTDIFGRVASGWFSDLVHFRHLHLLTLWNTLAGVFIILLPVSSLSGSYAALVVDSLLYGFCAGALTSMVFAVVPVIVGVDRMLEALALLQLIESGAGLLGSPLSGRMRAGSHETSCCMFVTDTFIFSFLLRD